MVVVMADYLVEKKGVILVVVMVGLMADCWVEN